MELKKDEVIIKEGEVLGRMASPSFSSIGTIHLTNQRIVFEYFVGTSILNLFSKPKKNEVEIPLTSIKDVKIPVKYSVRIDYSMDGDKFLLIQADGSNLDSLKFFTDAELNEFVAQIRKAANLPEK